MSTTRSAIEDSLISYTCEKDIGILIKVFTDFSIKAYFKLLCKKLDIDDFEAFSKLSEDAIKNPKHLKFYYNCKVTALIFEGCYYSRISYSDTQIALVAGLFYKLGEDDIFHDVPEKNALSEDQLEELKFIINKSNIKNSCDKNAIILDAYNMYPYWCGENHVVLVDKIKTHNATMHNLGLDQSANTVMVRVQQYSWKTRWGTLKSFNRNWPKIINALRVKLVNTYKSDYE